jgi:1-acyl-sn-glycerol-3-phosphate acyltransferase
MPYLRALAFVAAMAGFLILVAPVQFMARRYDWPLQHRIQLFFCRVICAVLGLRVTVHGRIPGDSPRFIVANHISWTDVIALASVHPLVFLAKKEVASWPVLGHLARLQGTIFVDRANRRAIPEVNAELAKRLRQGRDIVIFAEGTSSDGAKVLKFNASHFATLSDFTQNEASSLAVTVAPAALAYTRADAKYPSKSSHYDVGWYGDMAFVPHLWNLMRRGGARCHILFGESLAPAFCGDRKTLAQAAEARVRRLLETAFAAQSPTTMIENAQNDSQEPPKFQTPFRN